MGPLVGVAGEVIGTHATGPNRYTIGRAPDGDRHLPTRVGGPPRRPNGYGERHGEGAGLHIGWLKVPIPCYRHGGLAVLGMFLLQRHRLGHRVGGDHRLGRGISAEREEAEQVQEGVQAVTFLTERGGGTPGDGWLELEQVGRRRNGADPVTERMYQSAQ